MIELTVPWETRCDKAHERKAAKYAHLVEEFREKGWQSWLPPVEIGTRLMVPSAVTVEVFDCTGNERKHQVENSQ